jgi:hypothetical protein
MAARGIDPPTEGFFYRHSALYRTLFRLRHGKGAPPEGAPAGSADSLSVSADLARASYWSAREYPPPGREALGGALEVLGRIHDVLDGRGVPMSIVSVPYRAQVYVTVPATPEYDIGFPQRYVAAFAGERGLPYLDLLPGLRAGSRWGGPRGDLHAG